MDHPGFWTLAGPFPLSEIAAHADAELPRDADPSRAFVDIRPLQDAGPLHVAFFDNKRYLDQLAATRAGAVFIAPKFAPRLPEDSLALIAADPYRAYAKALELFYPEAGAPKCAAASESYLRRENGALVAESARLEDGVTIEPGAIVGPEAEIGSGATIAAGAVIGNRVAIGRNCFIGPNASITHALIGNRVILHAGVRIGQDGFGFAMGRNGHYKVRQIGRVIIQDDVEIGANSTIDRGALRDTVIGEGAKIDNLVQIAHNVIIGRHCVIVAQTGISGSTVLEDFVVMGGQSGTVGHIRVGAGAQVAGNSGVAESIPRGERWGGTPAKPLTLWAREIALLKRLAKKPKAGHSDETQSSDE
jgi:UDP-3-O-[3-hydroxymyristoyl] glucosamine N-acyltransferase